ncbi:coiled-coil domain-containing protein 152 isoform X4 [Hemicordylus capensis]|uniref:coiled-coil domain-containing protein 152 isoform X4 n=1 Tax=Hemicordylus capensis TaxID=884348 RepID=UPI002302799A|nr:coiled-coil domain-containing protein 152 isoform X4 [Hemicordylus capensis]
MKKISEVNLDKLLESFSQIEKKTFASAAVAHRGSSLPKVQEDVCSNSCQRASQTVPECATLQNMIKGLQQTIENLCHLRDENERLKNTVHISEKTLKTHEQEYKNQIDRLMREIESKGKEHKLEQRKIYCDMNKKIETMEEEHKQLIEKKDLEILELTRQLRDQEKEKQNEIIKLQIEFNEKLVRIQNKAPKPYPAPTALPLHQSIYRRKLQHLQEEKNKEIEVLRNTIRDLEQKLSKGQDSRLRWRQF